MTRWYESGQKQVKNDLIDHSLGRSTGPLSLLISLWCAHIEVSLHRPWRRPPVNGQLERTRTRRFNHVSPRYLRHRTTSEDGGHDTQASLTQWPLQFSLRILILTTMQLMDSAKVYKQEEPVFGHSMLKHYALDPEYINLNNGMAGYRGRSFSQEY